MKEFIRNPINDRDAYKNTHHLQLHKDYEWFSSYMEARNGAKHPYIINIGLGYKVQKAYSSPPTMAQVKQARKRMLVATGADYLNTDVWERVAKLGHYPMKIMGIPEGMKVPISTPLFRIEPTESWFAKTCNGEETKLMRTWYPMALATRLMILREELKPLFQKTNSLDSIDFAINGFEARSATSDDTADIAGMISLFVTRGSDNLMGQDMLDFYYQGGEDRLKTVWATEHACALSYGPGEGEYEYLKAQLSSHTNMIKSIVIDTYNTKNFVDKVMTRPDIKALILAHQGRIVLRNDSGNMTDMCLYILDSLSLNFGYNVKNGYKILSENLGVMQADGVNPRTVVNLYENIIERGWSAENMVVGGGTGLMFDELTRDYNRNAIKPSANIIGGKLISVNKRPKTDMSKASKGGVLKVDTNFITHSSIDYTQEEFDKIEDIMVPYYDNGAITVDHFPTIYNRIHN